MLGLAKRYYCDNIDYNCDNSTWNNWGRWVALVIIVVAIIILAFLFSCYNTRRRRRNGMAPMYGTGWFPGNKPNGYYPNQAGYNGAAPPYSPPFENQHTGTTFNNNDGYYGQHGGYTGPEPGIELQQPQSSYHPQRGGEPVYEAPLGPPPRKGDGVIR